MDANECGIGGLFRWSGGELVGWIGSGLRVLKRLLKGRLLMIICWIDWLDEEGNSLERLSVWCVDGKGMHGIE